MGSIEPAPERLAEFLKDMPNEGPVVMINLLRYREQADYAPDAGAEPCSGREAYTRYGQGVGPLLVEAGARPIWMGSVANTLISPDDEAWDDALLVEYPAVQAFVEMTSSPAYQAIAFHRTAALADSRLIGTTTGANLLPR